MSILRKGPSASTISLIAMLTAACVGSNYALVALPNIKLVDLIVFIAGMSFGVPVGVAVSVLSWLVYGVINPYGYNPVILCSSILGESLFGIAGGLVRRDPYGSRGGGLRWSVEMGLWGLVLTTAYDVLTNLAFAFVFGVPILSAIVSGWFLPPWFAIVHEVSNLLLFSAASFPLLRVISKVRGR